VIALAVWVYGLPAFLAWGRAPKPLQIYVIDVEGGQATLIVNPSKQSVLIDTGWPGFEGRDAGRIAAAAKRAGVKQLDYVLITHYHRDHVGGIAQLAVKMKIGAFVDHGPNQEDSDDTREDYSAYEKVAARGRRITLKPDNGLPLKGVTLRVLTGAGEHMKDPLPGAGEANPYCAAEPEAPVDETENARSLGVLVTYGRFRFIDLGDLVKMKELELSCPNNMLGTVDLYLVTHHGSEQSNTRAMVWALHPRVAIMNNGAHKGGSAAAWPIVHDSPGLQDLWQLHYAVEGGKDHNAGEAFIANVEGGADGNFIKVLATPDGTFTVSNSRNNYYKTYRK
jgi:beta-lactamase superfamily II metal-dependent hydrolase